jgi:hypothetical protein
MKQFPLLCWRSEVPVCVRGSGIDQSIFVLVVKPLVNWYSISPQAVCTDCVFHSAFIFNVNDGRLIAAHLFLVLFSLLPTFSLVLFPLPLASPLSVARCLPYPLPI